MPACGGAALGQAGRIATTRLDSVRLLGPGLDAAGWIVFSAAGIVALGRAEDPPPPTDEVVDGAGGWLLAGFIDVHSHGAVGVDTCTDGAEGIARLAAAKLDEGVTTWLPTTMSLPPDELEATFRAVAAYRRHLASSGSSATLGTAAAAGADVPGVHLEGPFLNPVAAGAQNPAHLRAFDLAEVERLEAIAPIRQITLAPEQPGGLEACEVLAARGIVVSAGHTRATCAEIRAAADRGLRQLTHFGNQMSPLHHREPGCVGAGLLDERLRLELIADGVHLSEDMLQLVWKLVAPERILLVTDSMQAAGLEEGMRTGFGGREVVVEDGVARLPDGTLAGSTARFWELFARVRRVTGLPPQQLVGATAANQARGLGLTDRGRLQAGRRADLVLLEPDSGRPRAVWLAGRRVR